MSLKTVATTCSASHLTWRAAYCSASLLHTLSSDTATRTRGDEISDRFNAEWARQRSSSGATVTPSGRARTHAGRTTPNILVVQRQSALLLLRAASSTVAVFNSGVG